MFYHNTCGNIVMLDVTESFSILGTFGIGKNTTIGVLNILQKGARFSEPHFQCPFCEKSVTKTDLYCVCYHCGKNVPITEAFYVIGSGGFYCKKHAISLFGEANITPLSNALSKLTQG